MMIGLITHRYAPGKHSPILAQVVQLLISWGVMVQLIYPEEQAIDITRLQGDNDLYVLISSTELALSFAGALAATGATVINSFQASALMRDRIVAAAILMNAGVPVPQTYAAAHPRQLAPVLQDPLVVRSCRSHKGSRLVWEPEELERVTAGQTACLAQRYLAPNGEEQKIYCVGGQLFGVVRRWPARTYEERVGVPFPLNTALREIAVRVGRAFDIDLFGIDIVHDGGAPHVVDVHSFPSFAGIPDAARRLADYIFTIAQRVCAGGKAIMAMEAAV